MSIVTIMNVKIYMIFLAKLLFMKALAHVLGRPMSSGAFGGFRQRTIVMGNHKQIWGKCQDLCLVNFLGKLEI